MREDRRLDNKDDGKVTISWTMGKGIAIPKEGTTYTFKFDDEAIWPSQSNTDETA